MAVPSRPSTPFFVAALVSSRRLRHHRITLTVKIRIFVTTVTLVLVRRSDQSMGAEAPEPPIDIPQDPAEFRDRHSHSPGVRWVGRSGSMSEWLPLAPRPGRPPLLRCRRRRRRLPPGRPSTKWSPAPQGSVAERTPPAHQASRRAGSKCFFSPDQQSM